MCVWRVIASLYARGIGLARLVVHQAVQVALGLLRVRVQLDAELLEELVDRWQGIQRRHAMLLVQSTKELLLCHLCRESRSISHRHASWIEIEIDTLPSGQSPLARNVKICSLTTLVFSLAMVSISRPPNPHVCPRVCVREQATIRLIDAIDRSNMSRMK